MNQQFLTNFSVVVIKYLESQSCFYLGNQSFIRSEIIMSTNQLESLFENYLFYVEIDSGGSSEFRTPIEFEQNILLRHKISNKYLSYSAEFENEENDTTVKLELSEQKVFFKILPCFQYQTKISNKIKFNQDVYLATQLNSTKMGFLTLRPTNAALKMKTLIGLNYKTKIMLQSYYEREKEEVGYIYGQSVWLNHIESNTFLTTVRPDNKEEILFEELKSEDPLQSINGLWLIDSIKPELGGHLFFGDSFRLKNLCTGRYLAFSRSYKLVNNQRIYSLLLEEKPSEHSRFTFHSLKGEESRILNGSYLIFHHEESGEYIGARRKERGQFDGFLPVSNFTQFEDEDLFEIKQLDEKAEEAIRFIFSIRKEFKYIKNCIAQGNLLDRQKAKEFKTLYLNIKQELIKLSHHAELFLEVQEELGFCIPEFCDHIKEFRARNSSEGELQELTKSIYEILEILCKDFKQNQIIGYSQMMIFIGDIFKNFGAEELICQIFKNNYSLLCRGPNESFGGCNIIRQIFKILMSESVGDKVGAYWTKIGKVLSVLETMVSFKGLRIDINQRLISNQLFEQNTFNRIFFEIKTISQRIRVFHPTLKRWIQMEQIRQKQLEVILERIFMLFSLLCENRNFISKRYIHSYLNEQNRDGIEIIISYLNVQISQTLTNTLFSFITNCYIDSAPRISRHRPLALMVFQINSQKESSNNLSAEETIMSGRIRDALLDHAQRSYATRPVDLTLPTTRPMASQPSLSAEQLSTYKEYLSEKINDNSWSPELLGSIRILMQLECYSVKQIQEIKGLLNNKILVGKMPANIVEHAMQFFDEVCVYCLEVELKKINTFLQMSYTDNKKDLTDKSIMHLLSINDKISTSLIPDNKMPIFAGWELKKKLSESYNAQIDVLRMLYAGNELRESVMKMFLASDQYSFSVLSIIFKIMLRFYLPKLQLVKLLGKSIIIPEEEVNTYQELFAIYKRMKYLVSISQNWMNNINDTQETSQFLKLLNRLCNYIFGDLEEGDLNKLRPGTPTNIKHQLLLCNFSLHLIVLQLLNKNFYLIQGKNRKEIPKKQKDVFQACFAFLEYFCRRSPKNIKKIVSNIYIIDRYRKLAEMGQIKVLNLLYREEPSLSKMLNIAFFQSIINKIIKQGKGSENCQYNPQFIEFLYTCCWSKKEIIKRNLEMINKILEKESVLRKLLFMDQKNSRYQLCLDIVKFKNEPLQVPFIYHKELLKLLTFLIVQLEAAGNQLKNRLKQYVSTEQLFELLSRPDIYSSNGVLPELNFLLKKQIYPLVTVYLDKNDSLVRYHESQYLLELLNSYLNIFNNQKELKTIQIENEYLMIPFLKKYRKALDNWKQNLRDYFEKEIRPLLLPFLSAIEKLTNKEKSRIYQKLLLLIENVSIESLTHNRLQQEVIGMQLVNIRWQNFVDDDEDNSPEEKYAKKNVLELLRNQKTYKIIEEEKQELFQCLKLEEKKFLVAMSRLVKMAVTEESTLDQEQSAFENFYLTVQNTAQYLAWRAKSPDKKNWQGKELIETLINYVARQTFNYNQPLARKSLYQILCIFNHLLKADGSETLLKDLYKIFHDNQSCFRFFNCIRQCIGETSQRIDSQIYFEQINLVMSEVYICGEERTLEIDKQALQFLALLCKYQPFTELLRNQPYTSSIDFLDKIYNSFYFMIRENRTEKLSLNIGIIDISESILDCLTAFLNGCNQTNQNFIVDNKFTEVVMDALKMQKIHDAGKTEIARRNRLLDEIIDFYASNGINLADILIQRIKIIDFRGVYLLNRFKFNILKLLLQCTLANDRTTNKVRILVPMELLKINLIWLYQDFIESGLKFGESLILRPRDDWVEVVQKDINAVFLMIGFYYFHLIELSNQTDKQNDDEEVEVTNDLEKQKQKIVKKFFSTISDKDRHLEKVKSFEQQPFAQEMKMFYNKYYLAYDFFRTRTLTVQANIFENLVKLYFPKLPLCEEFTEEMKEKLIENAERISQDQKLKSLMEFQQDAYEIIEGQQEYEAQISKNYALLGKIIRLMKNEEDIFLVIWIVSCIIILIYLIDDFNNPIVDFNATLGTYFTPTYLLDLLLLLVCMFNFFIGLIVLLNLIVKKIPFLNQFYHRRYEQLQGQKGNIYVYKVTNIVSQAFYDIYVIAFSTMTILHPVFAGFLLVYIVKRIALGKQIVQAIVETWFSLIIATGLLIVFNYIYSIYIYSASYTDDTGYGNTCTTLFKCLLMLVDQSLKSGSGFLGTALGSDAYIDMVVNVKVVSEITYIIFAQKVIFQIFSGTIIDKFSQLREKGDSTSQDEQSKCFICGQQRFQIDFELQGFEEHVNETHNKFYYIYYIFYLRRKSSSDFGIEEKFIWSKHEQENNSWIPDGTSLLKNMKQKQDAENKESTKQPQHQKYYEKKIQQLKKVRQRIENFNGQLKDDSTQ